MFARLLFIVIPLALLAFGVKLVINAVNFWIAATGKPNTLSVDAFVSPTEDFRVKVFYPEVIKSTDQGLNVEVEIQDNQPGVPFTSTVQVLVTDTCDYIRLDNPTHTFDLTSHLPIQDGDSLIISRNSTPPSYCGFDVKVMNAGKEYGSKHFDIYINSWLGHLKSVVNILVGLVVSLAGLRGALAVLGI
jgi:hypothetical protein